MERIELDRLWVKVLVMVWIRWICGSKYDQPHQDEHAVGFHACERHCRSVSGRRLVRILPPSNGGSGSRLNSIKSTLIKTE